MNTKIYIKEELSCVYTTVIKLKRASPPLGIDSLHILKLLNHNNTANDQKCS